MSSLRPTHKHISRLDVLRAAAFLMVLAIHVLYVRQWGLPWKGEFRDYSHWPAWAYPFVPCTWGSYGVALFFVISGYCIHLSFIRDPAAFEWKGFFWRRFLRLYPAYLVSMVICLSLQPFRHHWDDWSIWQIPTHLLFIHNLFGPDLFYGINGIYWSLGVEWQFYMLYALLLLGRQKWGLGRCLALSLVLNIFCQIAIYWFSLDWSLYGRFPLMTWCDWILGACLAEAHLQKKSLFTHGNLMLGLSFVMFMLALQLNRLGVQTYLFASVFFATVMDRYLLSETSPSRMERWLIPVGVVSYSLYLWHLPILYFANNFCLMFRLPADSLTSFSLYLLVALVTLATVATASWYYIEVGVPQWLKRRRLMPHVGRDLPESATTKAL